MKNKKKITTLKQARKRLKLTQEEMAKKLNVSRITISYWETNAISPLAKEMYRVSQAYEMSELEIAQWIKEISE